MYKKVSGSAIIFLVLSGYTNASFQFDRDDSKSQLRYVFTLNGKEISWKSSKHDMNVDSTIVAKYIQFSRQLRNWFG